MKIFLDDVRQTPPGWFRVYTAEEAIFLLSNTTVHKISLDHDLGEGHKTGYSVLLWIEEQVFTNYYMAPKMCVHSDNPPGRKRMLAAIERIKKEIIK